jgi:hypothetical protein
MKTIKVQSLTSDFLCVFPDEIMASDFLGAVIMRSLHSGKKGLTLEDVTACADEIAADSVVHELKLREPRAPATIPAPSNDVHPSVREALRELGVEI